mgnify:CR=1 FL=1
MLLGKVFSRPEKFSIYTRRIWFEIDALGFNSISLTAIISAFIGAVVALQMAITLESPFIPQFMIGYSTREVMVLAVRWHWNLVQLFLLFVYEIIFS